ncbi:MAG TPA: D-2-hydroxyacid dehydrogenase [Bryobacteraceae bacterium]|nr:D-2-hydroxyacid dehydrogenase [Bryobacteraceae bacterium]
MKIVVLDGYTLNPGDLSWDLLRGLAEVIVHDRLPAGEVARAAADADLVLTNKTPLRQDVLEQLPKLRYIGVLATGYDVVDVAAARSRGITVTNVPAYGSASVAQLVFALLLELCHHTALHSEMVRRGAWSQNPDWSFWRTPLIELSGKTLGIIGMGRIGSQVARIGSAFGMKTLAASRTSREGSTSLEELLRKSDVVSLHCPLTADTRSLINAERLALMKPAAFLINTARGALVNEQDLADALNQDRLAGAGIDVLPVEPPPDSPLFRAKNCIITPHLAWATKEARTRLMDVACQNVAAFLNGAPQNVVS